jgi:hypothetical protein
MLGISLERLGGLFDRQFLLAYWGPVFLGVAFGTGLFALGHGYQKTFKLWLSLSGTEQVLLGGTAIVGITVVAYLFSILTAPIIRLYEGYWPSGWHRLEHAMVAREKKAHAKLRDDMAALRGRSLAIPPENATAYISKSTRFISTFPRDPALLKATRLGNVLVAAEEYPLSRYNMDAVFWWPRLFAVMPEDQQNLVDASVTPMIALLNLSTIILVVSLGGAVWLFLSPRWGWPWWGLTCLVAAVVLPYIFYRVAAIQASNYTTVVRTMFDLHRFDLLQQMHIPLPPPDKERQVWGALMQWLHYSNSQARPDRFTHDDTSS